MIEAGIITRLLESPELYVNLVPTFLMYRVAMTALARIKTEEKK